MDRECEFVKAWVGKCGTPTDGGNLCEEHRYLKCSHCGQQATTECPAAESLVCDTPICENHKLCNYHSEEK